MPELEEIDEGVIGCDEMPTARQQLIDGLDYSANTLKNAAVSLFDAKSAQATVLADIQDQLKKMNTSLVSRMDQLSVQIRNADLRTTNARNVEKYQNPRLLKLSSMITLQPIEDYPTVLEDLESWPDKRLNTLLKHLGIEFAHGADAKAKVQAAQDAIL